MGTGSAMNYERLTNMGKKCPQTFREFCVEFNMMNSKVMRM